MAEQMQNNAESKGVYKSAAYREFVRWSALGIIEKHRTGITDQNEFAKAYRVNKDTLTRWKKRPDFNADVKEQLFEWSKGRTPDVIDAIYRGAMKGNIGSQKLWVDSFFDVNSFRKGLVPDGPLVHHSDIRALIETMPPSYRPKFYGHLGELHSALVDLGKKGLLVDSEMPDVDRETTLLDPGEWENIEEAIRANKEELDRIEREKPPSGV